LLCYELLCDYLPKYLIVGSTPPFAYLTRRLRLFSARVSPFVFPILGQLVRVYIDMLVTPPPWPWLSLDLYRSRLSMLYPRLLAVVALSGEVWFRYIWFPVVV
jgi:hypothetical protein